jgi:hypothetical protein
MSYNLRSIVNISKYAGKTVEQCINEHHYAFNAMINKNPQWYDDDVLDYLDECNQAIKGNKHSRALDKDYKKALQRKNT